MNNTHRLSNHSCIIYRGLAWSLVYLFINGRPALRALRPAPLVLLAAATGNATIYGKRAINSWI
jgi:hypothetical protein